MKQTVLAGQPPIKIGGEWRPPGKGPHDDVEVRVCYSFLHAPTLAKFLSNVDLQAMWLMVEDGGWRLTLKGRRRGKPVVAYFHERNLRDVVTLAATTLDCARVTWWEDPRPLST